MLTQAGIAAALGISTRQVQRLVAAGMPCTPVGIRDKRYDADECKSWLRANPTCLSSHSPTAASRSLSASTISAYTDICRRVQLRVTPSESKPS